MNAPMMDMPTLLSKFLALGMPLKDVILRATWNPAQVIHRPELGHLSVGAGADVAVWSILRGQFGYGDAYGGRIAGHAAADLRDDAAERRRSSGTGTRAPPTITGSSIPPTASGPASIASFRRSRRPACYHLDDDVEW